MKRLVRETAVQSVSPKNWLKRGSLRQQNPGLFIEELEMLRSICRLHDRKERTAWVPCVVERVAPVLLLAVNARKPRVFRAHASSMQRFLHTGSFYCGIITPTVFTSILVHWNPFASMMAMRMVVVVLFDVFVMTVSSAFNVYVPALLAPAASISV